MSWKENPRVEEGREEIEKKKEREVWCRECSSSWSCEAEEQKQPLVEFKTQCRDIDKNKYKTK